MAADAPDARVTELLSRLARSPRFAGSDAEGAARQVCRTELEQSGFACREVASEYSQWPGRWGPPVSAAVQLVTILVVARTARNGNPLMALAFAAVILFALAIISRDARRRWPLVFPLLRSSAVNLEASRGTPSVWLVAHIDSKSQTISMLYRIAGVVLLNVLTGAALAAVAWQATGSREVISYWLLLSLAAGLAAVPSLLCIVRNDSPGAVDNASGVAAVLLAADRIPRERALGVLITSAEELGLAGSRAWALTLAPGSRLLNCDTVDDAGVWLCMHTGVRPALSSHAETIASGMGFKLHTRRLLPGILADSVAFSDRGFEAITISRGSLATLARIHTRRDNSAALTGSGIGDAATLLAALTMELG